MRKHKRNCGRCGAILIVPKWKAKKENVYCTTSILCSRSKKQERTCPICKNLFFVSPSVVKVHCSRECFDKRTSYNEKCTVCQVGIYVTNGRRTKSKTRRFYCSVECMGIGNRGHNNPRYRGGTRKSGNGYIADNDFHGRHQHRIIMETHVGRKLNFNEVVHHINGNRTDNRIENLKIMDRAKHARMHNLRRGKQKVSVEIGINKNGWVHAGYFFVKNNKVISHSSIELMQDHIENDSTPPPF